MAIKQEIHIDSNQIPSSLWMCPKCPKEFKLKNHLQKHSKRHSLEGIEANFPCTQCTKLFRSRDHAIKHEKYVHGEKTHQCDQCQRCFSTKRDFIKHDCSYTSEYSCDQCDHKSVSRSKLNVHMRDIHNKHYKSHYCDICFKSFIRRLAMKHHRLSHTGEKAFQCNECGKQFKTNLLLKYHMVVHNGNDSKKFSCGVCSKVFPRMNSFQRHMKMHNEEKRFICTVCSKGFFQLINLQTHRKLHTGDHPYKCSVCDKTFIQLSNLKSHKQNHGHFTNDPDEYKKATDLEHNLIKYPCKIEEEKDIKTKFEYAGKLKEYVANIVTKTNNIIEFQKDNNSLYEGDNKKTLKEAEGYLKNDLNIDSVNPRAVEETSNVLQDKNFMKTITEIETSKVLQDKDLMETLTETQNLVETNCKLILEEQQDCIKNINDLNKCSAPFSVEQKKLLNNEEYFEKDERQNNEFGMNTRNRDLDNNIEDKYFSEDIINKELVVVKDDYKYPPFMKETSKMLVDTFQEEEYEIEYTKNNDLKTTTNGYQNPSKTTHDKNLVKISTQSEIENERQEEITIKLEENEYFIKNKDFRKMSIVKIEEQEDSIKNVDLSKISIGLSEKKMCFWKNEDYKEYDIENNDLAAKADVYKNLSLIEESSKINADENLLKILTETKTPDIKLENIKEETPFIFKSEIEIKNDIQESCITEKTYKCDECEKVLLSKRSLVAHQKLHTGLQAYKCDECEKVFLYKHNLVSHKRLHTDKQPFQCDECEKSFSYMSSFQVHKTYNHTDKKPYQCDVCGKSYKIVQDYKIHMRLHLGDDRYKCDECEKQCTTKQKFEVHKRLHSGEKPYVCDVCSKDFSQLHRLTVHMRLHTKEKPYVCNVCSDTFSDSTKLKVHIRIHTGETPFKCTICEKNCSKAYNLKVHMRSHTNEKPYKCTMCGEAFPISTKLNLHMRSHHFTERFQCTFCDQSFTKEHRLKVHNTKEHSGEPTFMPLTCPQCGKQFSKVNYLNKHIKRHVLEASGAMFPCSICSKEFKSEELVKLHEKYVHGEKKLQCEYCLRKLRTNRELRQHKCKNWHASTKNNCIIPESNHQIDLVEGF